MFDRCVCFGLSFTSDDNLSPTFISFLDSLILTQPGDRFSCSPLQQMYRDVRVLQNVLCRERICISCFADASQVLIPMDRILHVQMKNKHSASIKHPMDGILRALRRRCHPIDGKMKTTSSTFTDQPRLCRRKHCNLQHHPCFRALTNLQPRIRRRPRCSSARATGNPVAPTTDSKRNALLSALFWPFRELLHSPFLDFDLRETFFSRSHSRVLFFGRLHYRPSLDEFNTVRPPGDLHHNRWPSHFLQRFIFVRSLQSSPSIVCYGSVLFSVSV